MKSQHECWDGSGFPSGLTGDAIPLAARIVAIVDCYEDLLSDQNHRPALSHEAAMAYILAAAGSKFDRRLVECFETVAPDTQGENLVR